MFWSFHLLTYLWKVTSNFAFFSSMFPHKLLLLCSHILNYTFDITHLSSIPHSQKCFLLSSLIVFLTYPSFFSAWMFVSFSSASATSVGQQESEHPLRPLSHAKSCTQDTGIFTYVGFSCSVKQKDYFRSPLIKWKMDDMSQMWKAHW